MLCSGVTGEGFPLIKAETSLCFPGLLGGQGDVNESLQERTWLFFMCLIAGYNLSISYIRNISIWWYGQQVISKPTWFCSMNSRCWHTSGLDLGNKVGVSEAPPVLGIGQNKLAKPNVNRKQAACGLWNNNFHIKPHFYESSGSGRFKQHICIHLMGSTFGCADVTGSFGTDYSRTRFYSLGNT